MNDAHPATPTRPDATPEVLRLTAFAATPDGGNPAGVVLDATGLDDAALQAIAAELGYSETAFLVDPAIAGDDHHVRARYFSPTAEVPFCGHATIATAVALAERRGPGAFRFETPVGPIAIDTTLDPTHGSALGSTLDGHRMLAAFTSVTPAVRAPSADVAAELLALLGVTPADLDPRFPLLEAFAGNWHPVVALASPAVFDALTFDPASLRALMDRRDWRGTVTVLHAPPAAAPAPAAAAAPPAEFEVETRNLFPVGAITEDPATGSAAASLGAYLRHLGVVTTPARLTIHQGRHVGRPSLLVATIPPTGGIRVEGTATPIRTR
ncbi:PhzF family phenazine biosynthesis protein [Herbiconiux sp. CPCC 205716]|uniref:PhzF family phenazine biosynthesis protein n=1 Tax=Herbiconiux gentiana TaxID=2970912 RepID=A0ABT2GHV3_9MICO|nr:PhzF family phenazine biosynthesis protein [Herbiconiux gentiana]MCS5715748.1 PhzF family phenazine biosynthesis protein [Herbiconiux gentiana]